MSRRLLVSWGLLAAVVVAALVVGTASGSGPKTSQDRVYAIADTIKCPQCTGQTVAESDIEIARQIRADIARQIDDGRSDDQIRDDLAASYGDEYILTPGSGGLTGLVWVVPVVATVLALGGLAFVLWQWRSRPTRSATEEDRRVVAGARGGTIEHDDG